MEAARVDIAEAQGDADLQAIAEGIHIEADSALMESRIISAEKALISAVRDLRK